jgi:hypothetical protein
MAKPGSSKHVKSVIKTQSSKQYIELLKSADKTIGKYRDIVSRVIDKSKDEIEAEIQYIYLENLRKADDPVALMKENLVGLMLKKQTGDYLKEEMTKKALLTAELKGDQEEIDKLNALIVEDLTLSEFDLKVHTTIMNTIKAIEKSGPRQITVNTNNTDDKTFIPINHEAYDYD